MAKSSLNINIAKQTFGHKKEEEGTNNFLSTTAV